MKTFWQQATNGYSRGLSSQDFVRLGGDGVLYLSGKTHDRLGRAAALQVFYDAINRRLGLRPTTRVDPDAFYVGLRTKTKTARVCLKRVLNQFSIKLHTTHRFDDPKLDPEGFLIIDLSGLG